MLLGFVFAAALSPALASADAGIGELDGVIRDQQDNSVISGALVRLLDPSGDVVDQTTTTSAGRYALAAPTGVYNLDVTGSPAESRFIAKVRQVEVGAATNLNVTVSRQVRFSGRVHDAAGTPRSGVAVQASLGATVTKPDGTFEMFGPAGTHWVRLSRSFGQWDVQSVSVLISDVDLANDRSADLTFPIGSTKVIVRDDSGRPVAGATAALSSYETCPDGCPIDVQVMPGKTHTATFSNVEGVTDANGVVEFPTLPTRNLMLSASPPDGVALGIVQRTGITVPPAQPLQAVLRPTVTLRGRLTFGFDEGVSEGKLTLENGEYRSTEGDFGKDGSFAVTAPLGRQRRPDGVSRPRSRARRQGDHRRDDLGAALGRATGGRRRHAHLPRHRHGPGRRAPLR